MPESKKQEYIKKLLSAPQSSKRTLEMLQGHLCDNTLMRLFMKIFYMILISLTLDWQLEKLLTTIKNLNQKIINQINKPLFT